MSVRPHQFTLQHLLGLAVFVGFAAFLWWLWADFRTDLRNFGQFGEFDMRAPLRPITRHADWFVATLGLFGLLTFADWAWRKVQSNFHHD